MKICKHRLSDRVYRVCNMVSQIEFTEFVTLMSRWGQQTEEDLRAAFKVPTYNPQLLKTDEKCQDDDFLKTRKCQKCLI